MRHPEAVFLPIMMFSDYFLTVLGASLCEKRYSLHFKLEQYEMNPIWQKAIAKKQWLNLRHATLTILISGVLILLLELGDLPPDLAPFVLGCILVPLGLVLGRHFNNLLMFSLLNRKPDEVSGAVDMSHQFVLSLSAYQTFAVMVPVALIALFSQSYFARGGLAGIVLFLIVQSVWIRKAKGQKSPAGTKTAAPSVVLLVLGLLGL